MCVLKSSFSGEKTHSIQDWNLFLLAFIWIYAQVSLFVRLQHFIQCLLCKQQQKIKTAAPCNQIMPWSQFPKPGDQPRVKQPTLWHLLSAVDVFLDASFLLQPTLLFHYSHGMPFDRNSAFFQIDENHRCYFTQHEYPQFGQPKLTQFYLLSSLISCQASTWAHQPTSTTVHLSSTKWGLNSGFSHIWVTPLNAVWLSWA